MVVIVTMIVYVIFKLFVSNIAAALMSLLHVCLKNDFVFDEGKAD